MDKKSKLELQADSTGTIELVCGRKKSGATEPSVKAFFGKDEFGLLVDGLDAGEAVTLYLDGHLQNS